MRKKIFKLAVAILFSPEHVRLLALSATAPNIEELATWIRGILRHDIDVVIETHRPVPLVNLFQCQGMVFSDTHALKKEGYLNQENWPSGHDNRFRRRERFQGRHFQRFLRAKPNRADELVRRLSAERRLPCLFFVALVYLVDL